MALTILSVQSATNRKEKRRWIEAIQKILLLCVSSQIIRRCMQRRVVFGSDIILLMRDTSVHRKKKLERRQECRSSYANLRTKSFIEKKKTIRFLFGWLDERWNEVICRQLCPCQELTWRYRRSTIEDQSMYRSSEYECRDPRKIHFEKLMRAPSAISHLRGKFGKASFFDDLT